MQANRVAIVGSGGQLGQELVSEFSRRGFEVKGFARADLDISDQTQVEKTLTEFAPATVINSAAYNQVDKAEQEPLAAFQVNALAVRNLEIACRKISARLVHFSTDYVFDGTAGRSYTEDDMPRPLGAYAVSKLAGEYYARAYMDQTLVIRTSGVYGPAGAGTASGNFVESMLRLAAGGKPLKIVADVLASPAYAPALASRTADLIQREAQGIFHVAGGVPISWYEWAAKIFAAAGLKPDLSPTSSSEYRTAAQRPKFSALSNAKMESLGIEPMPTMDQAISLYMQARPHHLPVGKA